jgi:5-methylcytosine-specific restriction protein A
MMAGLHGTARWRKRALQQIRNEPLCCMCLKQGLIVAASVADHIQPHKNDADLFWNGALQSLCKRHHDSNKQRLERSGRRSNPCDINGKPLDLI